MDTQVMAEKQSEMDDALGSLENALMELESSANSLIDKIGTSLALSPPEKEQEDKKTAPEMKCPLVMSLRAYIGKANNIRQTLNSARERCQL